LIFVTIRADSSFQNMLNESRNPIRLIDALRKMNPGSSLRTLKQWLKWGRVRVNGEVVRSATHEIRPTDKIEVSREKIVPQLPPEVSLVYEDQHIIVVEKSEGMLSVRTPSEQRDTVYAHLLKYLRTKNPRARLFVVHRLDRGASGLLVFAKNAAAQKQLKSLFAAHNIERKYIALVEGRLRRKDGTIRSYLAENVFHRVYSTNDKSKGKLAVTHYRVIKQAARYAMLEVTLETGRKNQIRVHLAETGHPIAGDKEYGAKTNPIGRLALHAALLGFAHPISRQKMQLTSPIPASFSAVP
jgi:23S rRNA pseudouridine1911/1915/1917 synthase